ncbi:iron-containing alcohol dehydrogenase [Actinomycetospora endophytica]|uniref:Iron-containing alcohol dehydrogenase n=1 Tax=Actinomycetospora endophytica TaxID=2291215 RepID=A0ABS8PGT9_9PSEU|nr:iron-containing alcohol dehydrogenase [Actinomycetospora endophytica]MCD2196616.1 iron-containing alcohol dehydrogenase [Actinomycetospora endophytica]
MSAVEPRPGARVSDAASLTSSVSNAASLTPACACAATTPFVHEPGPAVDSGPGALARLGDHVLDVHSGARTGGAVIVTDRGLRATGIVDEALAVLAGVGCPTVVIDDVPGNPTVVSVEAGAGVVAEAFPGSRPVVVALGGGSALDAAKGIARLAADSSGPGLPLVAVPTTAGTGAETNGFGVLEDPARRCKVYCGDASTTPRVAVLDPLLTHGLPAGPTAATGVDALVHALESLVSRGRSPVSEAFAVEALRRVWRWLPAAVGDGADGTARAEMLVGAHLAGQALTRSGLGLVHALGHAITAHHGVVHGRALGLVLPEVVAWSLDGTGIVSGDTGPDDGAWARVAETLGVPVVAVPEALAGWCEAVGVSVGIDGEALGLGRPEIDALATTAAADPVGRNAPRAADRGALVGLLTRSVR